MTNDTLTGSSDETLSPAVTKRAHLKRALILEAAMRYFAEQGYEAARVADIASALGIAKGSVFQHFGSKDGLFLETYKEAARSLPGFFDVPEEVREGGFFSVVRYRLHHSEQIRESHDLQYRVVLLGNYGSDMKLKKRINSFLKREDPLGMMALVRVGIDRGEIRTDVDESLVASVLDCMFERFQDSLLMAEQDPELFHHPVGSTSKARDEQIEEFLTILQSAIGIPPRG